MNAWLTETRLAHLGVILAQLFFSGFHVVAAAVLTKENNVDPLMFAFWRELLSCMFMLVVALRFSSPAESPQLRWPRLSDWLGFAICGYCSCSNVVGSLFALNYLRPTQFSVMQPIIPVVAAVFNARQERLSTRRVLGVLCAVAGAILVSSQLQLSKDSGPESGSKGADTNTTLGFVIAAVQVTSMATLVTIQKPLLQEEGYDSTWFTLWYYSIGALFTVLFVIQQAMSPHGLDAVISNPSVWLGILYAAVFATTFPFNAFSYAGKHLQAGTITLYVALQPLFTSLLSSFFLDSHPSLLDAAGAALVVTGLVVTVDRQRDERSSQPAKDWQPLSHPQSPIE